MVVVVYDIEGTNLRSAFFHLPCFPPFSSCPGITVFPYRDYILTYGRAKVNLFD